MRNFVAMLVASLFVTVLLHADEGMWVYNNLPVEKIKSKYGFEATKEWADHVMRGSIRFNSGGSGSFVSSDGLVITNHHVAADMLQKISTAEHDYLKYGFYAKAQGDEIPAKDLELNQLDSIEDVTEAVNAAVTPEMTAEQAAAARKGAIAGIEKESFEKTGLRSDVIALYQGGQYQLYRFKKYTDVRLVFAPEASIAFFGGDADNFEFPRYDLDIAIFRAYENGQPVKPVAFFPFSQKGVSEGELIFVSGNPGKTSRLFTAATLKFVRDVSLPYMKKLLNRREISFEQYSLKGVEHARQAKADQFGVRNSRKVYDGRIRGLQDMTIIRAKQNAEAKLRGQVDGNPALVAYAGAWDQIEETLPRYKKLFLPYRLFETADGFNSRIFSIARILARMAVEDKKPNAERLDEFRDTNRASLLLSLFSTAETYSEFEKWKLADSLEYLVSTFGEDKALVRRILQGKDPKTRAAELIEQSGLADVDVRKYYAKGGLKAITESYDPMIELAQVIDSTARKYRKEYETKVVEPQRQAYSQIAKVIFALQGTNTYPDATFSLRLSYGEVKGYTDAGKKIPSMTKMGDTFAHSKTHQGVEGYDLPDSWLKHQAELDPETPFNFVSTADIIGGNSGSPVVNKDKEFVGIIFDGNIQSLTADYQYDDSVSRAVSVNSNAILEALRKIYGAGAVADELTRH